MALLTGLVTLLAYVISEFAGYGSSGVGVGLMIAGIINFLAYYFSDKIVIAQSGAKKITREQSPAYHAIVERLCMSAKLPVPALYVIPDKSLNAFATGRDKEHAAVAVTQGLLDSLESDELEGVVAHELAHIQNYDMRLMSTVSILVGMLNILSNMFWHTSMYGGSSNKDESRIHALVSIVVMMLTPLVGMLIQLAISRQREYHADASAVQMIGSPHGLIKALAKLGSTSRPLASANVATSHMYINNPFGKDAFFSSLFSTHPPIPDRIAKLQQLPL